MTWRGSQRCARTCSCPEKKDIDGTNSLRSAWAAYFYNTVSTIFVCVGFLFYSTSVWKRDILVEKSRTTNSCSCHEINKTDALIGRGEGGMGRRAGTSALRACAHGLDVPLWILGPPRTKSWQYRHVRRLWRRGLCLRTSPVDPYGCMLCTVLKPVIVGATQSSRCLGFLARPVSERAMPRTRPVPLRAMTRVWPVSCLCVERPGPREQPVSVRAMQRERPVPVRALPRAHRIGPNLHISALACCDFARGSCACWNLIHTNH